MSDELQLALVAVSAVFVGFILSLLLVDILDRPGKGRHSR